MSSSKADIERQIVACFELPGPMLGSGSEPRYRSPWRRSIPHRVTPNNRGDAKLFSFLAAWDETPEAETERMIRRVHMWAWGESNVRSVR